MDAPFIEFQSVRKAFGDHVVLDGVDLHIYKGEVTAVIGKSGEGKSVLLKHIIGLLHQDAGRILFEGRPMDAYQKAERRELKRKLSYMFQGTALFDSMTVWENIALPLKECFRLPMAEIRSRVRDKMTQLDLNGIDTQYPSQLSGGMQKRVALARALVTDPAIVLFDEPTTGLDPVRKNAVHRMISAYQLRFGFTAVVVSHDIPGIFDVAQRVAMLDAGRICFEGTPEEILQSKHPTISAFIRGEAMEPSQGSGVETPGERT